MGRIDKQLVTLDEAMEALGKSRRCLEIWRTKHDAPGFSKVDNEVRVDLEAVKQWCVETKRKIGPKAKKHAPARARAQDKADEEVSLTEARRRKELALAEKHEHAVAVAKGLFVHRDDVKDLVAGLFGMLKAKLEALPGSMANRWAAVDTSREMHDELKEWVRDTEKDLEKALREYGATNS